LDLAVPKDDQTDVDSDVSRDSEIKNKGKKAVNQKQKSPSKKEKSCTKRIYCR